jgi:hypothetical protein
MIHICNKHIKDWLSDNISKPFIGKLHVPPQNSA